jgi:transportin-1
MAFQPQEAELKQLAGFLKDSLSGYDRERQKNAEQVGVETRATPPGLAVYSTYTNTHG